jgi:pimeloyl-ACP methyl ester carboxylesterase
MESSRRHERLAPEAMYPAGIAGITVRYVTINGGLRFRVLDSGPERGPVVMLIHGWGANVYSFAETIPALVDAGHRVLALDLPGHGLSDKPIDDAVYTTRALATAVTLVATALGVSRLSVIGHSMGGAIALELARRSELAIDGLVLISSVGIGRALIVQPLRLLSPSIVNRFTPRLLTRRLVHLILRLAFATSGRPSQRDVDEYWAPSQFPEYAWACRACAHRFTWRRLAAAALRDIRIPVLVVTGGRDVLIRGAAKTARLIPTARVVNVPEGGHVVMQECATQTNPEILRFLRAGSGV